MMNIYSLTESDGQNLPELPDDLICGTHDLECQGVSGGIVNGSA